GAVEPHLAALREIDTQLGLMHACALHTRRRNGGAQIVPGDLLRLPQKRGQIGKARPQLRAAAGAHQEVVHAGDRLAGAAMRANAGEARGAHMERVELGSRFVSEYHPRPSSKMICCGPSSSTAGDAATALPSTRSKISRMAARSPSIALPTRVSTMRR